jgi:UDPglucose--hexose-1-phosphate uridylyltransferase
MGTNKNSAEFRKHYFLQNTVLMAPARTKRQVETVPNKPATTKCPFCNNTETAIASIEDESGWIIKSAENKNPLLSRNSVSAHGDHELIIDSQQHVSKFSDLSEHHIRLLLEFYANRISVLRQKKDTKCIVVYKNSGPCAGATIKHVHSQIATLPFVPSPVLDVSAAMAVYNRIHSKCQMCDIWVSETIEQNRLVYESHNVVAFTPFASEYPYELWIMPKEHIKSFSHLQGSVIKDFAEALKAATSYLDNNDFDFNYTIIDTHASHNHTYLRITPRNKLPHVSGGLEIATGLSVNVITPEHAAEAYREHVHSLLPAQRYAIVK